MNKVWQLGNLVRDPELKVTPKGVEVCKFAIAVNEKRGDEEKVNYFDWTAFGKQAEVISRYFHQGKPIAVCGRANQRRWTDKEGNNRSMMEFIMESFDFAGGDRRESAPAAEKPKDDLNQPLGDEEVPF